MLKTNSFSNRQLKRAGFTLVELVIVIAVIGILAAITVVSYNGIQDRAKSVSSQTLAKTIQTKAQLYYARTGVYPEDLADFNSLPESSIEDTTSIQFTNGSPPQHDVVNYISCLEYGTNRPVGYQISYWTDSGIEYAHEGMCS